MPAPDRPTLYNVEDAVEDAFAAIWDAYQTAHSGTVTAATQRETGDLPSNRVEFQLALGPAIGGRENAWTGQMTCRVFSARDATGRSRNGTMRGQLRACFPVVPCGLPSHPDFTDSVLPYSVINKLVGAGSAPEISDEDQLDVSILRFDLVISARTGGFPVDPFLPAASLAFIPANDLAFA